MRTDTDKLEEVRNLLEYEWQTRGGNPERFRSEPTADAILLLSRAIRYGWKS